VSAQLRSLVRREAAVAAREESVGLREDVSNDRERHRAAAGDQAPIMSEREIAVTVREETVRLREEALGALKLKKLILLTPYDQDTNDHEIDYLKQIGIAVVHDVALALPGSDDYLAQLPERWVELAVGHARDDADGYFLSCTNTTQIEAIEPIERRLGKPVVNSNQAVLWACMKRLRPKLGGAEPAPGLGRLVAGSL